MRARSAGLAVAALVLALDQANKHWLIEVYGIASRQPVHLSSFFDIVFAKNPGISYSLLSADTAAGRWALVMFTIVASLLIGVWLWRTGTWLVATALGLVLGGALGNAFDRIRYGWVADFYYFHLRSFHWYVFNLADVAIVFGVVLLLYDSFFVSGRESRAPV